MGMFDTIYVKKKLPLTKELKALDIEWDKVDFQTKDLDCSLGVYEITKSGKLLYHWQQLEWTKKPDSFLGVECEVVDEEWREENFHGTINFYTSHSDGDSYHWNYFDDADQMSWSEIEDLEGYDWWFEFEAYFTKGKLDSIKLIKAEKTPIRQRAAQSKEWALKRDEENKIWYNRLRSFLRKSRLYCKFVQLLSRTEQKVHEKVSRLLYKL